MIRIALCAALAAATLTGPLRAATVNEWDLPGGDASGSFAAPTEIGAGATAIAGRWSAGNDHDFLHFSGLRAGAQVLTVTFTPTSPIGPTDWGFSAGGVGLWQTAPFAHGWQGTAFANPNVQHWNRAASFVYQIVLDDSFAGRLWLGLYATHANAGTLDWHIAAPGNAAVVAGPPPAAVPLPAGGLLLLGALGMIAGARGRRG